jgi:hypothetical protein
VEREHFPQDEPKYEALPATHKLEILNSIKEFEKNEGMVLGQIMLRLLPTVQQNYQHCKHLPHSGTPLKVPTAN